MKLDQTDKKIIQLLGADARMSNNQMAKVIGVTEGTVRNRIQKLIKNKVKKLLSVNFSLIDLRNPNRMMIRRQKDAKEAVEIKLRRLEEEKI